MSEPVGMTETGFVYAACRTPGCAEEGKNKSYPTRLVYTHGTAVVYSDLAMRCLACGSFLPPEQRCERCGSADGSADTSVRLVTWCDTCGPTPLCAECEEVHRGEAMIEAQEFGSASPCSVEFCVERQPHYHYEDADYGEVLRPTTAPIDPNGEA